MDGKTQPSGISLGSLSESMAGAFSNLPMSSEAAKTFAKLFPEAKLFSISVEANSDLFLTALGNPEEEGWPRLIFQARASTLAGKVAAKQCPKFVHLRSLHGETGLPDVDFAASGFGCTAVIAVPIWSDSRSHVSGVLSLGLTMGSPTTPEQQRRLSCTCSILNGLAQSMAPILSRHTEYAIGNLRPFFPPWSTSKPQPHTCPKCPTPMGSLSTLPRDVAMRPFWLSFCDARTEAEFSKWFAVCMSRVDWVGHLVLLALSVAGVVKRVLHMDGPLASSLPGMLLILAIVLCRCLIMLFQPGWFFRYREPLLLAFPIVYQCIPSTLQWLSPHPSECQTGAEIQIQILWLVWMARGTGVFIFAFNTLFTVVRFRLSFLVELACMLVTLCKIPALCSTPKSESFSESACIARATTLLVLVGFAGPHLLTWMMERRARRYWAAQHSTAG